MAADPYPSIGAVKARLGVGEQRNALMGTKADCTRCYPHTWRWQNADLHTVQANLGTLDSVC